MRKGVGRDYEAQCNTEEEMLWSVLENVLPKDGFVTGHMKQHVLVQSICYQLLLQRWRRFIKLWRNGWK